MKKFGKTSEPLLKFKRDFIEENDRHVQEMRRISEIYLRQPRRTECKNCDGPLSQVAFKKLEVDYFLCGRCGHLNGGHEDTDEFCRAVYLEEGGKAYAKNYDSENSKNYWDRVREIYRPKAEFLIDSLAEEGCDPRDLRFVDCGAGSGYFVASLMDLGMEKVAGYEVSEYQVKLANDMLGRELIFPLGMDPDTNFSKTVRGDVVSMIGTLEHLQTPRKFLSGLIQNPEVKYFFLAVPLYSPCIFFEWVFSTVFNRQLSGAHTHLYSPKSLDWMCREFNLEKVSEWWFGTDMFDLYRSILVCLKQGLVSDNFVDEWSRFFLPLVDSLQYEIDKKNFSSEVHLLLKIRR